MPPKRRNSSQKNSLGTVKKSKSLLEDMTTSNSVITNEISHIAEECEIEVSEEKERTNISLRTALLIQDYLEFKAARSIQRFARGWLYRTKYRRKRMAAIKIQTEWRRFYCQRKFFLKVEQILQKHIEKHFYRAAEKIQALWRGWWVRHHVHDHSRLVNLQLLAGEDLLYCVAYKLHHLLRTHQIPGVYSLRNSNAYSKVEKLLNSLKFKSCNQRSIQNEQQRQHDSSVAARMHQKSTYGTEIPFAGLNLYNLCREKCAPLNNSKDADLRMSLILKTFEEANRDSSFLNLSKKKASYLKQFSETVSKRSTFCGDVIRSMKKWNIIQENKLTVDENVFRTPQNVENFLKEIESKMGFLPGNCYCGRDFVSELDKGKKKLPPTPKVSCTKMKVSIFDSVPKVREFIGRQPTIRIQTSKGPS